MSDLVAFKAMLKRAGIKWTDVPSHDGETIVRIEQDSESGERVTGYMDFYTELMFAPDGSLRAIGCWE